MISTFIFDLGNVLLRFSHDRMCDQIAAVGDLPPSEIKRVLFETALQQDFERGSCSEREFQRRLEEATKARFDAAALARAASEIFTPEPGMFELVSTLKRSGYRLVLLSNTCVTHIDHVRDNYRDLFELFDAHVLSYEVRAAKPEPAIFEAAVKAAGCPAAETFYTDDIAAYIDAARVHGIDAEVFEGQEVLRNHLAKRNVTLP